MGTPAAFEQHCMAALTCRLCCEMPLRYIDLATGMFLVQTVFDSIPPLCANTLSHVHTPVACCLLSSHRTNSTTVNYVIKVKKKKLCIAAALTKTLAKPLAWNPSIVLISSRNVSAVICIFAFLENPLLIIPNTMLMYCILEFFAFIVLCLMTISRAPRSCCGPGLSAASPGSIFHLHSSAVSEPEEKERVAFLVP